MPNRTELSAGPVACDAPIEEELPWWDRVIQLSAEDLCRTPCYVFDTRTITLPLTSEQERQREVLAFVTNLWIGAMDYDTRCPLRFIAETNEESTREALCDRLASLFDEICFLQKRTQTPELKARLSEFLWSYKRRVRLPVSIGVDAVEAYLAAAAQLPVSPNTSGPLCARFARALRLSANLPDKELRVRAKEAWMRAMQEEVAAGGYSLVLKSARLLVGKSSAIEQELTNLLTSLVDGFVAADMLSEVEEELCELAAKFHTKHPKRAQELRVKGATLSLTRAKLMVARDQQGIIGLILSRQAVAKLKQSQAPAAMLEDGLELLRLANSKIKEEHFQTISSEPIDCTREVRMFQAQVSNCRSADEALAKYCALQLIPDLRSLEKEVAAEQAGPASVADIFTAVTWSPDGRSAEEPSLRSSDSAERERAVIATLHKKAKWLRGVYANLAVKSCLAKLKADHSENLDIAVRKAVVQSRFIPESRKGLVLRGLIAGLQGNFIEALHFLIPQLETCFRHQIESRSSTSITPSRDARELQVMLFEQVFGRLESLGVLPENMLFNLRGLLTEEAGGNLRNKHCHGLLEETEYAGNEAVYLWWLVLRLTLQIV